MIYDYEGRILKYINEIIPAIKELTYAKEPELFGSMVQVTKLPAFLYYRQVSDWSYPFKYDVPSKAFDYANFVVVPQTYIGRIYVATMQQAFFVAHLIRFAWHKNPYVKIPYNGEDLRVSLRLLYIKVDEDRQVNDKKGPLRYVEFSWSSQLFMDSLTLANGLVEELRIFVDTEGVNVMSNDKLIKIIK